jgi:hypothetical protein
VYRVLHLCHVDELDGSALLHLVSSCQVLEDLKLENCSFGTTQLREHVVFSRRGTQSIL